MTTTTATTRTNAPRVNPNGRAAHVIISRAHNDWIDPGATYQPLDGERRVESMWSNQFSDVLQRELDAAQIDNTLIGGSLASAIRVANITAAQKRATHEVVIVEVHLNATAGTRPGDYAMCYAAQGAPRSIEFASCMARAVARAVPWKLYTGRGSHLPGVVLNPSEYREDVIGLLHQTSCRACIIEPGFIDNDAHWKTLNDTAYMRSLANRLATGVLEWQVL